MLSASRIRRNILLGLAGLVSLSLLAQVSANHILVRGQFHSRPLATRTQSIKDQECRIACTLTAAQGIVSGFKIKTSKPKLASAPGLGLNFGLAFWIVTALVAAYAVAVLAYKRQQALLCLWRI